jgi:hypothetical protein
MFENNIISNFISEHSVVFIIVFFCFDFASFYFK